MHNFAGPYSVEDHENKFMNKVLLAALAASTILFACAGNKDSTKDPFEDSVVLDDIDVFAYDYKKVYNAAETQYWDLMHTRLELKPDWEQSYLYGQATLTLQPYFYPQTTMVLDAKGFEINEISLMRYEERIPLKYSYDDMNITIQMDREYKRGEQVNIYIDYISKPNELEETYSEAIESDIGLYFIDPLDEDSTKPTQLWTQGEPEASSCWFPTIDQPNEKTTSDILITVEDKYVTLSNGVLLGDTVWDDGFRTDHWMMSQPHAPYLFMLVVGEFMVTTDTWRGMDVTYYLEEEYHPYANDIFGATPEMLDFYSERFGFDYPFEKYAQVVVRDFVSGAMENTTATIHFSGLHQTPRQMLDGDRQDIIAHELVHHWFGDLVTCESWANLPLNESFATYGEYLWFEYKDGRDAADDHKRKDLGAYLNEAQRKQVNLIRYDYESPNDMFDRHSYQKGGLVLHYLRYILGDDAFFEGLKLYLNDNAYKPAEIDHLRLAMEEVTGQDLHWFFDQWFFNAGHPIMEVEYIWAEEGVQHVIVSQESSNATGFVFQVPFDIDFYLNGEVVRKSMTLKDPIDTFSFTFDSKPLTIDFDPENYVLAEISDSMSIAEYKYLYENAPRYLSRLNALVAIKDYQSESKEAEQVIWDAMDDEYWHIAFRAASYVDEDHFKGNQEMIDLLSEMAVGHEKSAVREECIDKLVDLKAESAEEYINQALNDSSYSVQGAALSAMFDINEERALEVAEKWEKEKSSSIRNAVAETYASVGGSEKQEYFEKKISSTDGWGLYNMLFYYGNFLGRMDKEATLTGLTTMMDAAERTDAWWSDYAATGGMNRIISGQEVQISKLEAELKELDKVNLTREEEIKAEIEDLNFSIDKVKEQIAFLEEEKEDHP